MSHVLAERPDVDRPDNLAHHARAFLGDQTSGWKLAGGVEADVRQTRTVDKASKSSA
jgi:hypothetical protein